jgi:hypothetical protein
VLSDSERISSALFPQILTEESPAIALAVRPDCEIERVHPPFHEHELTVDVDALRATVAFIGEVK